MLVRTPRPIATESPSGYLLRLSEANGYPTPRIVLEYAGFTDPARPPCPLPVEKLSPVVGWSEADLAAISYVRNHAHGGESVSLMGQDLAASRTNLLRFHHPMLCPLCIAEHGYAEAFWDLSLAVICPVHGCKLLSHCPNCGKRLTWFRPGLLVCRCGADLSEAPLEQASQKAVDLMSTLYAKAHAEALRARLNPSRFPLAELDAISLSSVLGIVEALGKLGLRSKGEHVRAARYAIAAEAAECLADYPEGFYRLLARLGLRYMEMAPTATSLRKQFESFYEVMFKNADFAVDADFLRKEFLNFGLTRWGYAVVDARMLHGGWGEAMKPARFVSMSAYARAKKVRPITLRRWAERGLITIHSIKTAGQVRYIVDADSLGLAKQSAGETMDERVAASYVGLPVSVLRSLRASGHFEVVHMPRYKRGYHEKDLRAFRRKLIGRASRLSTEQSSVKCVSLHYVMQEMRFWSTNGKAAFVAAYLDRKISGAIKKGDNIGDIRFQLSDVIACAEESKRAASDGAVSQKEAAAYLGCDYAAIRGLVEKDFLGGVPGPNRMRVRTQSLNRFASVYVPLVAIARRERTSVIRLLRICHNADVEVLSMPRIRGSAVPFIRHQDEEALLRRAAACPARETRRKMRAAQAPPGVLRRLQAYLRRLEENDSKLPRRAGKLNKTVIARACGFDRNSLYENTQAESLLAEADASDQQRYGAPNSLTSEALRDEIAARARRGTLPRRHDGGVNRSRLAMQLGLDRRVFYLDRSVAELLRRLDSSVTLSL